MGRVLGGISNLRHRYIVYYSSSIFGFHFLTTLRDGNPPYLESVADLPQHFGTRKKEKNALFSSLSNPTVGLFHTSKCVLGKKNLKNIRPLRFPHARIERSRLELPSWFQVNLDKPWKKPCRRVLKQTRERDRDFRFRRHSLWRSPSSAAGGNPATFFLCPVNNFDDAVLCFETHLMHCWTAVAIICTQRFPYIYIIWVPDTLSFSAKHLNFCPVCVCTWPGWAVRDEMSPSRFVTMSQLRSLGSSG